MDAAAVGVHVLLDGNDGPADDLGDLDPVCLGGGLQPFPILVRQAEREDFGRAGCFLWHTG